MKTLWENHSAETLAYLLKILSASIVASFLSPSCVMQSWLPSLSSLSALHSLIISQCISTRAFLWLSCLYGDEQSSHHNSSFLGPLRFLSKQETSLLSHFLFAQWEQKMQSSRRILQQHIAHVPGDEWDISTTVHEQNKRGYFNIASQPGQSCTVWPEESIQEIGSW